ncbi:(2Fe-2S)-binding protein [Actinacidiphila sp. DG2A-62]|uniref:(2Fe-2S)-binding protein n=1 Tax=Actinacidiphila sp. DG2A-62 TaxID=3108821 RepID=UPI002DB92D4D|nr:(2Fe-2S)-binding protein [Actinacidiphila sp. DG2A-62]MEC3993770.1 (2Fe-2S)-binding protein [Actinacidiphila sp. DG2A-62]
MTEHERSEEPGDGFSRRGLLGRASAVVVGAAVVSTAPPGAASASDAAAPATPAPGVHPVDVRLTVNGRPVRLRADPRWTLLDTLRERLELTGTKKGCDRGQCGACTVHVDGRRVLSCLTLAAAADGSEVRTIEGLADGGELHPMQQAFIDHDGFQCGACTPGQIMSAVALVDEGRATSDDEIREHMSGNICRCSAYPFIVDAVTAGSKVMR